MALALALLAAARSAPAEDASEKQIIVYNRGKVLRYDSDAGADLKEVVLETYDCHEGKLVKKETLETYYHLSDDKEIITPAAICDECRKVFRIEKRDERYYFLGVREKPAETTEEVKAAETAAPPITTAESAQNLEEKVKKIAREIVKVDASKKGSAAIRSRIITGEFTSSMQGFGAPELEKIAGFVTGDESLSPNQKYYVLRSFGYAFFERKDYPKSVFFYDKCIALAPDNYSGHFQKAVAQERAGMNDDAVRSYAKALALKPQKSIASYFYDLVKRIKKTVKLGEGEVAELEKKLDSVRAALEQNDAARASSEAKALAALVESWYGGTAPPATPGTPPPQAPAPQKGE
jgi:tetratricopeptide (TPR) repeat protein